MNKLVAFTGFPRSGKDTVCDLLVERHGFTKMAFADPLYQEVSEAYEVSVDLLKSDAWKTTPQRSLAVIHCHDLKFAQLLREHGYMTLEPITSRRVLQLWGTEYRRFSDPEYWTKRMRERLAPALDEGKKVAISDCRVYVGSDGNTEYNEGHLVHEYGGSLYRVVRPEAKSTGHSSDLLFPQEMLAGQIVNVADLVALYTELMFTLEDV